MPGENKTTNNRVSTREFFEVQLDTQKQLVEMERRILEEIKPLGKIATQVDTNTKEIEKLRNRSNWFDGILGVLTLIAAALGISIKAP